jgi:hypothetical protein
MPAKPPISIRRPSRADAGISQPPTPIAQAAIPAIDPDSADALAYALRGRSATLEAGMPGNPGMPADVSGPSTPAPEAKDGVDEEVGHISVKLPPEISRKLSAIADRRGSKRTHVALEVLEPQLRDLAAQHRAGRFPELPKVVSGSVRASVAFMLPPDLASDLSYILATRRAVKAQVIVRLLVPAIEHLHARETTMQYDHSAKTPGMASETRDVRGGRWKS